MYHCLFKILLIHALICVAALNLTAQYDIKVRQAVMKRAAENVGFIEYGKNQGALYTYYRDVYKAVTGAAQHPESATCGMALSSWYISCGINPNIKTANRAKSWYTECKAPIMIWAMSVDQLSKLPRASAIVFKVGSGHHVGLFVKASGYDLYTIEANTSTRRSLVKYAERKEGVFACRTRINETSIRPYAICDVLTQSTPYLQTQKITELQIKNLGK